MTKSKKHIWISILKYFIIALFIVVFLIPLWLVLTSSFEESSSFSMHGYSLIVHKFSFAAYGRLVQDMTFWKSFANSVWVTAATVALSLIVNILTAYVLHIKTMPLHKFFNVLFVCSMFFNAGMIPTYLIIKSVGITNSFLALILPASLSVYNVLLIRNYMYSLPRSMEEAAVMDGANHFQILFRIIVPVSKPVIVTTLLMTLVFKWNSWMDVLLYIDYGKEKFWTVQFYINHLQNSLMAADQKDLTGEGVRSAQVMSAAIVVTILPVILLFPMLQKYFANGITLGSVKG